MNCASSSDNIRFIIVVKQFKIYKISFCHFSFKKDLKWNMGFSFISFELLKVKLAVLTGTKMIIKRLFNLILLLLGVKQRGFYI